MFVCARYRDSETSRTRGTRSRNDFRSFVGNVGNTKIVSLLEWDVVYS